MINVGGTAYMANCEAQVGAMRALPSLFEMLSPRLSHFDYLGTYYLAY